MSMEFSMVKGYYIAKKCIRKQSTTRQFGDLDHPLWTTFFSRFSSIPDKSRIQFTLFSLVFGGTTIPFLIAEYFAIRFDEIFKWKKVVLIKESFCFLKS